MPGCFHPEFRFEGWQKLARGGHCPALPKGREKIMLHLGCDASPSVLQPLLLPLKWYIMIMLPIISNNIAVNRVLTIRLCFQYKLVLHFGVNNKTKLMCFLVCKVRCK